MQRFELRNMLKFKLRKYFPGVYSKIWIMMQLTKRIRHGRKLDSENTGFCPICGNRTKFFVPNDSLLGEYPKGLRNSCFCRYCRSASRNRAVALAIIKVLKDHFDITVSSLAELSSRLSEGKAVVSFYEAGAHGPINVTLSHLKTYTCSEFFPGVILGGKKHGIRCENLEHLTFLDDSFDFIISEDVFEHIRDVEKAWSEIYRILRQGGCHIFTVPIDVDVTTQRVKVSELGAMYDTHVLPAEYHGDPLRGKGIIAYNNFGFDLPQILESHGFQTKLVSFYDKSFGIPIELNVFISSKPIKEQSTPRLAV